MLNDGDHVLITGITGFLGRHLAAKLKDKCNIFGISQSEQRILCFHDKFPSIKIYRGDIVDINFLERVITDNKITKIIHCAAMKNMWVCQNNITQCINTNIIGSLNLINLSKKHNVLDFIAISTDKANNPSCVYGMSKHIMEKMILENGFRIFQGVNFLWSDGSVLEFWYKMYKNNQPLMLYSNVERYFCDVNEICDKIISSTDQIVTTDKNYRISIEKLLKSFCEAFHYDNYIVDIKEYKYEKHVEEILSQTYTDPTIDEVIQLLKSTFQQTILYV